MQHMIIDCYMYLRDKEMYKESHYKKLKLYRYRYILTKIYFVD